MSPSTSPVLSAGTVVFCGGVLSVKLPPARLVIGVETPARFRSGRVWPATEGYAGGASMGIALSLCIAKNLLGIRTMRGSITGNLLQGTRKTTGVKPRCIPLACFTGIITARLLIVKRRFFAALRMTGAGLVIVSAAKNLPSHQAPDLSF